jgi:hypothetical protein
MRQKLTFAFACALVFLGALIGSSQLRADTGTDPEPTTTTTTTETAPQLSQRDFQKVLDVYRREVWRWQRLMGRPLTRDLTDSPPERAEKVEAWKRFAARVRNQAEHPPHQQQWLCIHHFEGAWNDPNPPYYGGLQMDLGFQRTYGRGLLARKGTANHWTPLEQMWTAERAHRSGRGFYPWPNTARYCGLI